MTGFKQSPLVIISSCQILDNYDLIFVSQNSAMDDQSQAILSCLLHITKFGPITNDTVVVTPSLHSTNETLTT